MGQMPMMGQGGQMPMGQMPMMGQGGQMPMMGRGQMQPGRMPMMGRMMDRDDRRDDMERPARRPGMLMRGGPRVGWPIPVLRDFSLDEVRRGLQAQLEAIGNPRLKLGPLTEQGELVIADIVTVDNSLVQRVEINLRTGAMREVR